MATKRSDLFNTWPNNPLGTVGKTLRTTQFSTNLTSGNSAAGDILILGGPYTIGDRIAGVYGALPALTSATSNDLGLYVVNPATGVFTPYSTAAAIIFWSAVNLTSAAAWNNQLFALNTALVRTSNIGDLLSLGPDSAPPQGFYLGLRMNVANTATATLALDVSIEQATTK